MKQPRAPSMGSDAPGGEGTNTKGGPQQLLDPLAVTHGRQEKKPREAGVIVSFGAWPAVAPPPRPRKLTTVLVVDKAKLCYSLCSLALKRPIYQCAAGHLACGGCRVKLEANACRACGDRGAASAYTLCPGLDVFYSEFYLSCPYEPYGCESYIPYYRAASHQSACCASARSPTAPSPSRRGRCSPTSPTTPTPGPSTGSPASAPSTRSSSSVSDGAPSAGDETLLRWWRFSRMLRTRAKSSSSEEKPLISAAAVVAAARAGVEGPTREAEVEEETCATAAARGRVMVNK